jgi:uncharacterized protein with HEPN domain
MTVNREFAKKGKPVDGGPQFEKRKITGLRNVLAHEYFGVSLPLVWDVVRNKLDSLSSACEKLTEGSAFE